MLVNLVVVVVVCRAKSNRQPIVFDFIAYIQFKMIFVPDFNEINVNYFQCVWKLKRWSFHMLDHMFWTQFLFLLQKCYNDPKLLISIHFSSILNARRKERFFLYWSLRFVSADEINSFDSKWENIYIWENAAEKSNEKYVFTWHFFLWICTEFPVTYGRKNERRPKKR